MSDTATPTVPSDTPGDLWRKSPAVWKAAPIVGIVGFAFKLGDFSKRTVNGVVESCSGFDAGPFITAVVVAVLAVAGYRTMSARHPAQRLSRRTTLIVLGALLVFAAVHLVRGVVDPSGGYC